MEGPSKIILSPAMEQQMRRTNAREMVMIPAGAWADLMERLLGQVPPLLMVASQRFCRSTNPDIDIAADMALEEAEALFRAYNRKAEAEAAGADNEAEGEEALAEAERDA